MTLDSTRNSCDVFLPACGADNSNYFCSQPCVASPAENDHSPSSHEHCRASLLHRCCRKGEVEESEVALFSAEQCPPDECTPDVPRDGIMTPSQTDIAPCSDRMGWDLDGTSGANTNNNFRR